MIGDNEFDVRLFTQRLMEKQSAQQPDDEPATGNYIPREGNNPAPPPISSDAHNRDFLRRLVDPVAANQPNLPEQETRP